MRLADLELRARVEEGARDADALDVGAVRAAKVADLVAVFGDGDFAVALGDGGVLEDEVVLRAGADGELLLVDEELLALEGAADDQQLRFADADDVAVLVAAQKERVGLEAAVVVG